MSEDKIERNPSNPLMDLMDGALSNLQTSITSAGIADA